MKTWPQIFLSNQMVVMLRIEDSGEEDGGGFLNNLSGKQLNAPAELVISSQRYSSIGASAHSLETPSCSDSHTNISDSIPHQHENEEPKENS